VARPKTLQLAPKLKTALRQAQLHLVNAVETMSQGFVLRDSQNKILLCNSHFEEIIDSARDMTLPGADFAALIEDAAQRGVFDCAQDQLEDFLAGRLSNDQLVARETEFQLSDRHWIQVISEMTEDGGVIET
jgi:PAS domain-containing protein